MFSDRINRRDFFAVLAVLSLALLLFLRPWQSREDGTYLIVSTPDGTGEYRLDEDRELEITSRGITLRIVIRDGAAYVAESTCRDRVCVNSGKLTKGGDSLLCAPAGVRLKVKGGTADADFIAG